MNNDLNKQVSLSMDQWKCVIHSLACLSDSDNVEDIIDEIEHQLEITNELFFKGKNND